MSALWVYTIVRNEAGLLPYFLRHYTAIADRIIIYDDGSDDGSVDIANSFQKVEIRKWPFTTGLDDERFVAFMSEQYKEARRCADWVAVVDPDEILWHPDIRTMLSTYKKSGITVPLIQGWNMLHPSFPTGAGQIYEEITKGIRADVYSKPCLINPSIDMSWAPGRHSCHHLVKGIRSKRADIKLLHFRYLGGEYTKQRNARNYSRLNEQSRAKQYGFTTYPNWKGPCTAEWADEALLHAHTVMPETAHENAMRLIHHGCDPYDGFDHDKWPARSVEWGSRHPWFQRILEETKPDIAIEIGTFVGDSACHMASLMKKYEWASTLICIDTFLGDAGHWKDESVRQTLGNRFGRPTIYEAFLARVIRENLTDYIVPLPMISRDALEVLTAHGIKAKMIYVDGGHDDATAYFDIINYFDHVLLPGGVMLIDDCNRLEGVIIAVNRFVTQRKLKMEQSNEKVLLRKS